MRDGGIDQRTVKAANKSVYNAKTIDDYERNESIFSSERQERIRETIARLRGATGVGMVLDLGCGTGNVARIAGEFFPRVVGMDIGYRLLSQCRARHPNVAFVGGDGDHLPFADASFDGITMYAFLHHMLDHGRLIREAARVLKPGGFLYTDHDMNYYFVRLYFPIARIAAGFKPSQFDSRIEDIAEIRNTVVPGIDPVALRGKMRRSGFDDVEIRYWTTGNRDLSFPRRLAAAGSRFLAARFSPRLFATHFSVIARKRS